MDKSTKPLTANPKSLGYFFDFLKRMEQKDIIIVYAGEFSQTLTKTLLAFTERKFKVENIEDQVKRKIFNIMVEMLQNISKNALDNDHENKKTSPIFMIGESDACYFLISSNKIRSENVSKLKSRIDQVNALDSEGLKKLYKQVRIEGSFSNLGGAGIGIIDMARKSENKLIYEFTSLSEEFSMFSLYIKVAKNTAINQKPL